jgi:hypothetical protein
LRAKSIDNRGYGNSSIRVDRGYLADVQVHPVDASLAGLAQDACQLDDICPPGQLMKSMVKDLRCLGQAIITHQLLRMV